ncbi:MAG: metallopeptidase family M24 [Leptospiraceae bacterium]|nr:metallopeptidase family M24 [Leptospiraceae bacterium]
MPLEQKKGLLGRLSSRLSRMKSESVRMPTEEDKAGFLKAQRMGYDCVTTVEKELREGCTEKQAARLLDTYLKDHGVRVYLHRPFAWFGDHARFDGYRRFTQFHPSKRILNADEPFILDVSPVVDGYSGDIGYSTCLRPNVDLDYGMNFLLRLRAKIPQYFASDMNASEIWWKIDQEVRENGFDNVHAKYPLSVLGHRVYRFKLPNLRLPRIPVSASSWFSLQGQYEFLTHKIMPDLLGPDHEGSKLGLWAIEPHLGRGKVGFKFEEILVVEENQAYWLDDNVPHVRRAKTGVTP